MFKLRTNLTEQCPCESGKTYADCCFRKGVAYLNIFFIALALAIITVGFWPWNLIAVAIPALLVALFIRARINQSGFDDDEEEDDEDEDEIEEEPDDEEDV